MQNLENGHHVQEEVCSRVNKASFVIPRTDTRYVCVCVCVVNNVIIAKTSSINLIKLSQLVCTINNASRIC